MNFIIFIYGNPFKLTNAHEQVYTTTKKQQQFNKLDNVNEQLNEHTPNMMDQKSNQIIYFGETLIFVLHKSSVDWLI